MHPERDQDLTGFNTLGLPARARFFARLTELAQLDEWRARPELTRLPWRILGGGSNLWLCGDLEAFVIKVELRGRRLAGEDAAARYVAAAAGESWQELVAWTVAQGWGGLEGLSLIPGTVGAAPVQNVGAYGCEVKDALHELTAIDLRSGERRRFGSAECAFGYRDSRFKREPDRWLISEAVFRLPKDHAPRTGYGEIEKELAALGLAPTPGSVARAVVEVRSRKLPDPARLGNAGSFFKNPVVPAAVRERLAAEHPGLVSFEQPGGGWKLAAGWLIERAGWKGRRLGPVGMYERQALVLVNHGGATGEDVARLVEEVRADVRARFGVELEPEPVRWDDR